MLLQSIPISTSCRTRRTQGPSADIDLAGLENSDAERSPSVSNSPCPSLGKQVRPTTGQALRPSTRKPSYKDRQPASASLGPVHSSKVSKAAGKKKPGSQQRLKKVSSGGLPLPSGNAAEPQPSPVPVNLHKGPRIQPSIPGVAMDSKRITRSKSKQNITDNMTAGSSAKPQGKSKRQRVSEEGSPKNPWS